MNHEQASPASPERVKPAEELEAGRHAADHLHDGPHFASVIEGAYGLDPDAAQRTADIVEQSLYAAWSRNSQGQHLEEWTAQVPQSALRLAVDLAALGAGDYFEAQHQLRLTRVVLGDLAARLRGI
ncbi:hypothetical protein ABT095_25680 [Kitasatospora sp. NPDC002227]|uniref:hypothetical protein n=1 Tax=Kitasatospora sp. NPDC002227 TaxID=3154773 RepID=UPI00331F34AF